MLILYTFLLVHGKDNKAFQKQPMCVSSSFCLHVVHIISFSMPFAKAGHIPKAYYGMEKCSPLKCHCKLDGNGRGCIILL